MKRISCAFVVVVLMITFGSCEKGTSLSTKDLVEGQWALSAYGVDKNMNGLLEPGEYTKTTSGVTAPYYTFETFQKDGTGTIAFDNGEGSTGSQIIWALSNNNQTLQVTANGATSTFTISNLTLYELQVYDPNSNPRVIYLYARISRFN